MILHRFFSSPIFNSEPLSITPTAHVQEMNGGLISVVLNSELVRIVMSSVINLGVTFFFLE